MRTPTKTLAGTKTIALVGASPRPERSRRPAELGTGPRSLLLRDELDDEVEDRGEEDERLLDVNEDATEVLVLLC